MGSIGFGDILLRLAVAFVAGLLVGWERESHGRPAGLRTNILVCVASAVAMLVSEIIFVQSANAMPSGSVRTDPARMGAGILTGIGFLGAGTILRHENFVRGVTTAATIWCLAILGLAFGGGFFLIGGLGFALALFTLHILPILEKIIESDWYATATVTARLKSLSAEQLKQRLESLGMMILSIKLDYDFSTQRKTLKCELKVKRSKRFDAPQALMAGLADCPGILRVDWSFFPLISFPDFVFDLRWGFVRLRLLL